jgi:hypothetical protein
MPFGLGVVPPRGFAQSRHFFVREADDVKIAQRFIAGFACTMNVSPRSGRLKAKSESARNLNRPFHGLICKYRLEPSTKKCWAILMSSALRTRPTPPFGKSPGSETPTTSRNDHQTGLIEQH